MSQLESKKMYESLLESGDLLDLFPMLSGEWDKDEKEFRVQQNLNDQLVDDFDPNELL